MKKTILFILLSISTFGQNKEYKKTVKLFDEKKYQEVDAISDELLSEKYGKLSDEVLYYTLNMSADSNNALNNYDKAIVKYKKIIEFVNRGTIELKNKSDYLNQINNHINELKNKISSQKTVVPKTNEIPSKALDSSPSNSDRTVTLTVTGTGKTIEEAKQNALRSAIEQAFGTFISSKTEILNDNLVKDEIVSIANGNIQKFDVISEVQIPNLGYATTLKATVSVTKLTSFVESKGIVAEFKGSLFSFNIKQQILNEKNEIKAITDMCDVAKKISDISFDYSIQANEPKAVDGKNEQWNIPITIDVRTNKNFFRLIGYINNTLNSLSLSKEEAIDYVKLGKKIYPISFGESNNKFQYFVLRNEKSIDLLVDQIYYFNNSMINFTVKNGMSDFDIKNNSNSQNKVSISMNDENFRPIIISFRFGNGGFLFPSLFKDDCFDGPCDNLNPNFNYKEVYKKINVYSDFSTIKNDRSRFYGRVEILKNLDTVNSQLGLIITFLGINEADKIVTIKYNDLLSLSDINNLTEYKILTKN